ncbi:glycoside hydrolase family 16 protein [Microvirga terricola]|uniref:Glycoside hydrolase family 16 protein n=1 Tax=Microvirga terricola TaxID=2719797 RepID=A0ABX0VBT4_9HYPH|nr:glycoside hydrolase family 16 protein [Microvirga terricola]NIX75282.1 glycoside hydrolase family 16 protein [Microvirga terricola]
MIRIAIVLIAGLAVLIGMPLLRPASLAIQKTAIDPHNPGETGVLTFSDDFSTLNLWNGADGTWDTAFPWSAANGAALFTNRERQWYINARYEPTASIKPWHISDGKLIITADRAPPSVKPLINGYNYTSGMLSTYHSFSQTYGYFEMRAKFPAGKGMWPAFWLLPANGHWPPEIDVVEMLGHDPGKIYMTVHSKASGRSTEQQGSIRVNDTSSGFHTYGIYWGPDTITWYLDGNPTYSAPTPADMHQPFYLVVNLAVGGRWPGDPNESTHFPAAMEVEYIRAYKTR